MVTVLDGLSGSTSLMSKPKLFSSALLLPIPVSSLSYCNFLVVIARTFAGNTYVMKFDFVLFCIGFSEFNKLAMCNVSHSHFLHHFVCKICLFRTEHSTYFILTNVCHFVGKLEHKEVLFVFLNLPSRYSNTFRSPKESLASSCRSPWRLCSPWDDWGFPLISNIFMHKTRSVNQVTLLWVSLERYFPRRETHV